MIKKLEDAISQVRADLEDLERCLPDWQDSNTASSRQYKAIARRIVCSAQRLNQLVVQHTYTQADALPR